MIAMFHEIRDGHAQLVRENGITIAVPMELLATAGLGQLRTGQRLVIVLDPHGAAAAVRLP